MSESCSRSEELVALLGHEAQSERQAELARHVKTCPSCQAELALLKEGFLALGKAPVPADSLVEQRIAARVMPEIMADLDVAQRPPAASSSQPWPLLIAGGLSALAPPLAALVWLKVGAVIVHPALALGLALLPLWVLPALHGSRLLQGATLMLATSLAAALMFSTVSGVEVALLQGLGCLPLALSGSLLPAAIVFFAAARGDADVLRNALLGAAIGSGGAALQRLFCNIGGLDHALLFHLGPFLFLIGLCAVLGSRLSRKLDQPA